MINGDIKLAESMSIALYVEENFPGKINLLPK